MKKLVDFHRQEYEEAPKVTVTIPGVYTLVGMFSDFCKGYTLCGGASHSLEVALSPRSDQSVRLFIAPLKDRKRFNMQNIKFRREDRWANYIKGVISVLKNRGFTTGGFNITFSGDLLQEEGEIVNSALTLGAAIAIKTLFHRELKLEDCAAISYSALSSFAQIPCRLVLFLAMLYVKENSLLLFDVHQLTYERIPFTTHDSSLFTMIVESQISPHALEEELSLRKKETKVAFSTLKTLFPNRFLRDISEQEVKESLHTISEEEKRIILFVLAESRLAKEAAHLLEQKEMVMYGRLLSRVQAGLRDVFEVTCPEVDWLSKRALEINGCLGATMITTGSSGTLLVLLSHESIALYTAKMEEYEHIFGFRPTWREYIPVGPLKVNTYH